MPHRARIFQNWTYDGRVEANQVFRVRACSLHNFEEVQSGSRFCTNKFDVGIPFQIGGDVDAQELERRNSFDSNSIDDKMRWRTKDDFFRLLAVQFHVVGHCPVEKFTNDFIEPASFLPFQEFRQSCVVDELVSETVQPQGVNEDDEDYRSQPCTLRHSSIQCQPPRKELPDPDTLLSVLQERIYPADNVARDAKLHEPFASENCPRSRLRRGINKKKRNRRNRLQRAGKAVFIEIRQGKLVWTYSTITLFLAYRLFQHSVQIPSIV